MFFVVLCGLSDLSLTMQGHKVHKGDTKNTTKSGSNTRDQGREIVPGI